MTRSRDPKVAKSITCAIKKNRQKKFPGHGGQKKMADLLGVSSARWSAWESGKAVPSDPEQRRLAEFFGISLAELRGDYSPPPAVGAVPSEAEEIKTLEEWRALAVERLARIDQLKAENERIIAENARITNENTRLLTLVEGFIAHPTREGNTPVKAAAG